MDSFAVGPLTFPTEPVLFLVAVVLAFSVGRWFARRIGISVERALWSVLFVGVASARLAFVVTYWSSYADSPWAVFNIRDGGMNTVLGITGAALMAALLAARNKAMRRAIAVSVLTGLTLWGGMIATLQVNRTSKLLPAIALFNLEGQTVALDTLKGKPVVINLWASWCPPCQREMPALQEAQKQHGNVVFVFANQGETAKAVHEYIGSKHLTLENVLLDQTGSIAMHVSAAGLPTTLFFDKHGELVDTRMGEVSQGSLAQRIKQLQAP